MRLKRRIVATLAVGLLAVLLLAPQSAHAQREDILTNEACREDPQSRECICREVEGIASVPRDVSYAVYPYTVLMFDSDGNGSLDTPIADYDPISRTWSVNQDYRNSNLWAPSGSSWPEPDEVLHTAENSEYRAYCALAYFRENLRRLWYFALAVGAGFAAISVAWGGVVYMQQSSSGEDRAQARTIIIRVLLGLIILASAFFVLEAVSTFFIDRFEPWETAPGLLDGF